MSEYTTVSRETWSAAVRALDSGDPGDREKALTALMLAAPPGWGVDLDCDLATEPNQPVPAHGLGLHRDDHGVYTVRRDREVLVEFTAAEPNWWTGRRLPGGTTRRMYQPHDGTPAGELRAAQRVAERLL